MIFLIDGPAKSGKSRIANALRNDQIAKGNGALLVDETQNGAPNHLLEKLLVGGVGTLTSATDAAKLEWKKNCDVIVVGAKKSILADFEKLVPGFKKQFGPVVTLTTSRAAAETSAASRGGDE